MEYYSAIKKKKILPENRMIAIGGVGGVGGRLSGEGLSQKEKRLIGMDTSVVIAGGEGYKGVK